MAAIYVGGKLTKDRIASVNKSLQYEIKIDFNEQDYLILSA